jgi:hypothetical protein
MNATRRLRFEQVQRMEQVRAELDHVEHACRERSTRLVDTRAAALANRHQLDAFQSRQQRLGESDVVKRRFRELLAAKDRSLGANFGVADSLLHFHWQLDEAAANAYSSTTYGASHAEVAAAATTTAAATKAAVFEAAVGGIVGSHASSAAVPASGTTSRTATPPRDSIPGNSKRTSSVRVADTPPSTPPATPVAAASTSNATVIASPVRTNYRTWNPTGIQLIAHPAGVAVATSELVGGL